MSSEKTTILEDDFFVLKYHNTEEDIQKKIKEVSKDYIQIHFSLKGQNKLIFNNGRYTMDVAPHSALFFYNPNEDLPINLDLIPGAKYIILVVGIDRFHRFFSPEAGLIQFLEGENAKKKYYTKKELTPRENVVLTEIFNFNLSSSLEVLYTKGKVYELLSLFFNKNDSDDNCPFLKDEANVKKIIQAKTILIEQMDNPPTLQQLAQMIGLSLKKLKDGFRQIYGDTVYNFLLNHKLEKAREMLESRKYNISEVSDHIGYSTPSHFIAAFKKKYGTTPKKFMGGL